MSRKRSRSHAAKVYDYTLGSFDLGATGGGTSFLSALLPRAVVIGGLGAIVYGLFFSKKAVEKKNAKDTEVPTGRDTGAGVTSGSVVFAAFRDAGSGVSVSGPSGMLVLTPTGMHTVKAGESWANIASRAFGDYRWWPAIWDFNRLSGKFGAPTTLAVGDVIELPKLPVSKKYQDAIFARAEADRAWEIKKSKQGAKKAGGRPQAVLAITPMPLEADAVTGSGAGAGGRYINPTGMTSIELPPGAQDPVAVAAGAPVPPAVQEADMFLTDNQLAAQEQGSEAYEDLSL